MVRSRMFAMLAVVTVAGMLVSMVPLNGAVASGAQSPSSRHSAGMAYDAATGEVVLFGGYGGSYLGDTWTWDGTTWTEQHPAKSPPVRFGMGMTYDAALGEVVLFGGWSRHDSFLNDTWTWDGTTWKRQHPATSPSPRNSMGMTYDAARSEVVLFGGEHDKRGYALGDTWTWDGMTWTQENPATSPSARAGMGMAYGAALGEVVLFGGMDFHNGQYFGDTWTWDGTTWTEQHPATSPSARAAVGMAYDAARGELVLFGGADEPVFPGDTWTWDGTTWMQQDPAAVPTARHSMGVAFDAARAKVVLFGGYAYLGAYLGDTWTWNSTNWRVPFKAHLHLSPNSGSPGTAVQVTGTGFGGFEQVTATFIDSVNGATVLGTFTTDASGNLAAQVTVPANATLGVQKVTAVGTGSHQKATAKFTVT